MAANRAANSSFLGPSTQHLWETKPAMINQHVFILPNRKNIYLTNFLSKLSIPAVAAGELGTVKSDVADACIFGLAKWCGKADDSVTGTVVISLTGQSHQEVVKVLLTGEATKNFPVSMTGTQVSVYVYGATPYNSSDSDLQAKDSLLTLTVNGSNHQSCVIMVHKWLYMRLTGKGKNAVLSDLPNPVRGALPLGDKSESEKEATSNKPSQVVDSQQSSKPTRKRTRGTENRSKASTATGPSTQPYVYTPLDRLENAMENDRVNICGVVKFFKPLYHTRGTDYCSSFTIFDHTSQSNGIHCIFFNKDRSKLPDFCQTGDIILLRRMKINRYQNVPQALGQFYSSFHIFDGGCGQPLEPRISSSNSTLSPDDDKIVRDLRKWFAEAKETASRPRMQSLAEVQPNSFFDLVAQVVAVFHIVSDNCACLSVCDGTELSHPVAKASSDFLPIASDKHLMKKYGRLVVDIKIYDALKCNVSKVLAGDYIFMRNIHASLLHVVTEHGEKVAMLELLVHRNVQNQTNTSLCQLEEDCREVIALKERLKSCHLSTSSSQVVSAVTPSTTLCLHPNQTFSSLHNVLTCEKAPNMFRCYIQPDSIQPGKINEIVQLRCPKCLHRGKMEGQLGSGEVVRPGSACSSCANRSSNPPQLQFMYVFVLKLVDKSGSLQAYLISENSALFLQGITPTNLTVDTGSRDKVHARLNRLFGCDPFDETAMKETVDTRPWMDCCIMSYYSHGMPKCEKEMKDAHISYRIFDTILLEND